MARAIIRKAETRDMEAMVSLLRELFSIENDFRFDAETQRRGLELLLNDTDCAAAGTVLAAEVRGQTVGMGSCQLFVSTAQGGLSGLVEDLVVFPEHRGQGIGNALMQGLKDWAEEQGATRLQLLADKTNGPALEFYGQSGWQTTNMICLRRSLGKAD